MKAEAKTLGFKGWTNLGARQECLNCGSLDLNDLENPLSAEAKRKKKEIMSCIELWEKSSSKRTKAEKAINQLGKKLTEDVRSKLLYRVSYSFEKRRWQEIISFAGTMSKGGILSWHLSLIVNKWLRYQPLVQSSSNK